MCAVTVLEPNEFQYERPACGPLPRAGDSICWRVWAPSARSVELVLHPGAPALHAAQPNMGRSSAGGEARRIVMAPEPDGYFVHTEPDVPDGQRYGFRLDGGPERPDPASLWQPDGIHQPSAVVRLDRFAWSEGDWGGIELDALVIYELHVGAFTPEGTFEAIIPRIELLRELGVTAIELMPVMQFPGERSWGYDTAHLYAVQNSYGGPRGLQRLVNACHRTGLAVILDVVHNHLGPEGNYCAEFGPYFTERYRTPWGPAMNFDDRGSDAVREFVLENVRHWIRDFRVDGLRLDAVHAIYDRSPTHILREMKSAAADAARRLGRPVHLIAESDLNDVRLIDPAESGGYGLDAQWSDDFHHSLHALLTGERSTYYADFGKPEQLVKALNRTFVYDGAYSPYRGRRHGKPVGKHPSGQFVISIQNHDQVGNRPRGERLSTLLEPAQQRLAAGLLLLAPQIPLIFMGEEYGETHPFPFFCSFLDAEIARNVRRGRASELASAGIEGAFPDPQAEETFLSAKLAWSWPASSRHAGLRRLYYNLLTIRRFWLPVRDSREHESYLMESWHDISSVLRMARTIVAEGEKLELIAYFNLSNERQPLVDPGRGTHTLLICSEDVQFGGARGSGDPLDALLPYEFWVFDPRFRSTA